MVGFIQPADGERTVEAPTACALNGSSPIFSVTLGDGEEVQWRWTHLPNGQSLVTGYEIIKQDEKKDRFNFEAAVSAWLWGEEKEGRKTG